MKIGLYSEMARQHIAKIRDEIGKSGIKKSERARSQFRNALIGSREPHHKLVVNSLDFYSSSMFRDLVFHAQEHRFTLAQIKENLSSLGLDFCGFEGPIVDDFRRNFGRKDDLYCLEAWESYEASNMFAFAGMYQFWCQKKC